MRIGKFAEKFNVKLETIRYYIEEDLLIPQKKGHYYHFDDEVIEDMRLILKLKSYHFSIKEIAQALTVKRLTPFITKEDHSFLLPALEEKKKELQKQITEYEHSIHQIEEEVQRYNTMAIERVTTKGISLSFLPFLHCPLCQKELILLEAQIVNQQIYNGLLECSCHYQATIENGIIMTHHLDEEAYNKFYIYDLKMIQTINSSLVNVIEKCSLHVKKKFLEEDLRGKIILESHVDTYVFLNRFSKELNPDALYIFTGSTVPMLKILKTEMETQNPQLNVLYILNSGLDLPLKKQCIDIVIDSYSFNEFSLFHNAYPMKRLENYLSKTSVVYGSYFTYEDLSKTLINKNKLYPHSLFENLTPSFMSLNMRHCNKTLTLNKKIGTISDPGKYLKYHVQGEEASFYSYIGN